PQRSESRKRLNAGQRNQFVVALVKRDRARNIDIGNAVTVSHTEGLIAIQILRDPLQAPPRAGRVAGIHQRDAPWLRDGLMHRHLVVVHVKCHIGSMQEVVGEILLDDIALVAAADDEVIDAVLRIDLQDVPKNGPAANLDNRLFRKARAEPARENYGFHSETPSAKLLAIRANCQNIIAAYIVI